jgi:hypothetical protein
MIGSVSSGFRRRRPRNATRAAIAATPSAAGSRKPRPDVRASVCEISAFGSSNARHTVCACRPAGLSCFSWTATARRCDCTSCTAFPVVASFDGTAEASGRIVGASPRAIVRATGVAAPTGSIGTVLSAGSPIASLLVALAAGGSATAAVASGAAWPVSGVELAIASAAGAASSTGGGAAAGSAAAAAAGRAPEPTRGGRKVNGST